MAKSCTDMADIYKNVEHCQGQVSMPGAIEKAYFIKKTKITKWPKLPFAEATDIDKVAVYDGDFGLAADAKFHRIDLMPNEMEPESEQVGAYGSYHFNNKATLPIPGTAEKATGTIAMMNNDDIIIVLFQRDGKARIIGDPGFHTNVKPAQMMLTKRASRPLAKVLFHCLSIQASWLLMTVKSAVQLGS